MSNKALTALAFLAGGLLTVVVFVGLAQKSLDTTGVAVALCSLTTGLVGAAVLRSKNPPPPPPGGDPQ